MTEEGKDYTLQPRFLSALEPVATAISLDHRRKQKRTSRKSPRKKYKIGTPVVAHVFSDSQPVQNKKSQTKEARNAYREESSRHYHP